MKFFDDYVLFDLETTGLLPDSDSVIEISALKVRGGEIADEFTTFVNPEMHIPYSISSITGIMDDMVSSAPVMEDALRDFISFAGDDVLVGHNIKNFDLRFVQRFAVQFFAKPLTNDYLDTLALARRYLPELDSRSLESLAEHYDISYEGAHRALADCHINKLVYDRLAEEMRNPSEAAKNIPVCPRCGNILKKRDGKFGEFWGCASYPDCKFTKNC